MIFKTRIRCFLTIAGMALVTIICISCCSMLRRQTIEGAWSNPQVSLSNIKYDWNQRRSHVLVQCDYQLSQTASLRHSRKIWKDTDWQREITERVNVISSGSLAATVNANGTMVRPLPFKDVPGQIISIPPKSGWVLSFPETINFVAVTNIQTIYHAPAGATISMLNVPPNDATIAFCLTRGWKTECIQLNIESLSPQVQYSFDASGAHGVRITPDAILYLDPDPRFTVFITEKGTRPNTGTLAVGINTQNNTPISVLHPKDVAADAQGYEWMLSPDKKSLGLRIQHKNNKSETLWISKTGTLPEFQRVDESEWNEMMVQAKQELPSAITAGIKKQLEKELPEQPDQNNYYPPLTR